MQQIITELSLWAHEHHYDSSRRHDLWDAARDNNSRLRSSYPGSEVIIGLPFDYKGNDTRILFVVRTAAGRLEYLEIDADTWSVKESHDMPTVRAVLGVLHVYHHSRLKAPWFKNLVQAVAPLLPGDNEENSQW